MRPSDEIPDILQRIVAAKQEDLQRRIAEVPPAEMRARAERMPPDRSFADALRGDSPRVKLIAEVKVASPSAGRLMDDERRARLPLLYAQHGAAAISVLTERHHFRGDLRHLAEAKESLGSRFSETPLLRKDFLFDPYQVWESKAAGADAVLLIVAILSADRLSELLAIAHEIGLGCLVETHDEREVEEALAAGATIVGINNRDLRTFQVDLATTERLHPLIPADRIVVAESGIHARADVERMADCGVDAVLVGEALVRANDVATKMRELLL